MRYYIYKYFVGHSAMMGQSLNDEVAEGIKEVSPERIYQREKFINLTPSDMAETLLIG